MGIAIGLNSFDVYKDNGTNVNNNNSKKGEFSDYSQKIKECYDELCTYSEPSMTNICSIWNSGFKSEGNGFYSKHMGYCDIYGAAAASFGNAAMQKGNLDEAFLNVKNSTSTAVSGLKGLIAEEKIFMGNNKIGIEEEQAQTNKLNPENNSDNNDSGFLGSVINFFFG